MRNAISCSNSDKGFVDPQIDHLTMANKDLNKKISKLKTGILKQEVSNAELKKQNLKLKDHIIELSKSGVTNRYESIGLPKRKSSSNLKQIDNSYNESNDNHILHPSKSNSHLQTFNSKSAKENRHPVPSKLRPVRGQRPAGLTLAEHSTPHALLKPAVNGKQPCRETADRRAASVSRLGQQLADLQAELREERHVNRRVQQGIARIVQDSGEVDDSAADGDQLRSTSKTVAGKRSCVLHAFGKFAEKIKSMQVAD